MIAHVGANVARLRERRGWTQEVLATKVGLHRVTLARIETGALAPSLKTLARLAEALGASVERLVSAPRLTPKRPRGPR